MACLLYYMVIKQTFQYKTKGIYLKMRPKERNFPSPSEMNMWNSVLQALLTRIRLINEMLIVIASHQYFQCFLEHVKVLIIITA